MPPPRRQALALDITIGFLTSRLCCAGASRPLTRPPARKNRQQSGQGAQSSTPQNGKRAIAEPLDVTAAMQVSGQRPGGTSGAYNRSLCRSAPVLSHYPDAGTARLTDVPDIPADRFLPSCRAWRRDAGSARAIPSRLLRRRWPSARRCRWDAHQSAGSAELPSLLRRSRWLPWARCRATARWSGGSAGWRCSRSGTSEEVEIQGGRTRPACGCWRLVTDAASPALLFIMARCRARILGPAAAIRRRPNRAIHGAVSVMSADGHDYHAHVHELLR
jgi:hypothetical protein